MAQLVQLAMTVGLHGDVCEYVIQRRLPAGKFKTLVDGSFTVTVGVDTPGELAAAVLGPLLAALEDDLAQVLEPF